MYYNKYIVKKSLKIYRKSEVCWTYSRIDFAAAINIVGKSRQLGKRMTMNHLLFSFVACISVLMWMVTLQPYIWWHGEQVHFWAQLEPKYSLEQMFVQLSPWYPAGHAAIQNTK